jgi:predicted amidophosphoribosyltransferase
MKKVDGRDTGYDTRAQTRRAQASVYSTCAIHLVRSHGPCAGCHAVRDNINGYCDTCRALGANEKQVRNPGLILKSEP